MIILKEAKMSKYKSNKESYIRAQLNIFDELIVDNFAGGGGASTGIELATGRPVDVAINHNPEAIKLHKMNHPFTKHYCESVWDVDPREVCEGRKVALCWFSPDCTHFSKAKGGKPKDKTIRGLAWVAVRWAATVRPRVIILENVEEFQTWGPLDKNGQPIKREKGRTFRSFVHALEAQGYEVKWKELRACDYGAPTIRKRFFLIARCDGKPIEFPEPTHGPEGSGLIPYRTAADIIDWSLPTKSIFARKKALAENTQRRIARGLDKFTIKAERPFIIPIGSADHKVLTAASLIQYHSETSHSEVRGQALDMPVMTVDASPRYALTAAHIVKYYSGDNYSNANAPLHTITTKERNALVEAHLCVLRRNADCRSQSQPLPTITSSGAHFAEIHTKIVKYYNGVDLGNWIEVRDMLNTYCDYTMADNEILLLEMNGKNYFIYDIGMRMLEPRELYNAQGFPPDYIIQFSENGKEYSKKEQVARCGNAVPPPFAEALVRANLPELCGKKYTTMEDLQENMAI